MPKQTIFLEAPVFSLLRIEDGIFDAIIDDPYLTYVVERLCICTCLNFRGDVFGPWKFMREQRKDIFYETTGVLMEDNEKWHDTRSKVQQDLMRPKSAHYYMHEIDNISEEFMKFIRKTRSTDEKIMKNSLPELYRFTLESICYIALDTRLGCMNVPLDPEISKMFEASKAFLSKLFLIKEDLHLST